jgi:hypothetical protein
VESAPRAYRLKASNAAPPFSTFRGTSPRKVGKQQMDIDFFREALRLIDALEAKTLAAETNATSSTRSSKR